MPPLLSIKDLTIQLSNDGVQTKVVDSISFDVKAGEILAIVGESGSGKSVTALSILQLLPKAFSVSGDILFDHNENETLNLLNLPTAGMNKIRGNKIAMIFQEPMTSLNPVLTCGQQVMEVLQLHRQLTKKAARKRTLQLFENVDLPDPPSFVDRYPHQVSGGQKQRVMIAMAMSCNPSLLIADEPTTALDVTVQKTILELIGSLQQQYKMGVILITHDLGVVADIADTIAVMYKGVIVEQGNAAKILQAPQHPYTKALLSCRPSGNSKGKRLPVVSDFMETLQGSQTSSEHQTPLPLMNTSDTVPVPRNPRAPGLLPGTPVLQVKGLDVCYPAKRDLFGNKSGLVKALDDVNFSVMQGETVGLVGESGCGKTTLGRTILQLIRPSSGEIFLNGEDIAKIKASVFRRKRKDLQIVFQDPYGSLDPRITIGNAILEPMKVHGIWGSNSQRREKAMDLLKKVSLPEDHFNRYPHQFSGGQRQRICIARALASEPSFLIFDESVSALDVSVQAQVLNLLNDLKKEFGFTAIFISHDLSVVHYFCNRILVMNKGKIVEEGEADQVYYHPKNSYTQMLIDAIPGKRSAPYP